MTRRSALYALTFAVATTVAAEALALYLLNKAGEALVHISETIDDMQEDLFHD